jgi:hypothetical protein
MITQISVIYFSKRHHVKNNSVIIVEACCSLCRHPILCVLPPLWFGCAVEVCHTPLPQAAVCRGRPPSQPELMYHHPDLCNCNIGCAHLTMNYESGMGVAPILSWHLSGMPERNHKKT